MISKFLVGYKLSSCFFFASNSSCVIAPMSSKPLSFLISSSGSVAGDDCVVYGADCSTAGSVVSDFRAFSGKLLIKSTKAIALGTIDCLKTASVPLIFPL